MVVPMGAGAAQATGCPQPGKTTPEVAEGKPPQQLTRDKTSRIDWASLLNQPNVVAKILGHLGMPTVPEGIAPARLPKRQLDFDLDAA